jgi:hypothetical protein
MAECSKHQQRQHTAHLQHPLLPEQSQHGGEQAQVAHAVRGGGQVRQALPQRHGQRQHQRSGAEVHAAPAGQIAHPARKDARQQQAHEHTALRRSHHPPPLVRCSGTGCIGDQALRHGRAQQADAQHARQQHRRRRRKAHGGQRGHQGHPLHRHQAAPVHPVAQRHQQQQGQRAANLRGRDNAAHRRLGHAEIMRQRIQQRLRVVHVGHAQAGGRSKQQHQAARHACSAGGGGSAAPARRQR